jgi:NACHT domain
LKFGVTHFYFDYAERQGAETALRCLLKQLVYQLESVPPELERAYDLWDGQDMRPSFVSLFITLSQKFSKVFIILDGFDEVLEDQRRLLVGDLKALLRGAPNVYAYVTTRPHLLQEFTRELPTKMLEIKADDDDVVKYLKQQLEHEDLDDDLKRNITESISCQAKGQSHLLYSPLTSDFC